MLKITKNQGSIQVTADKSGFYPFDGTITFPTNSLFTATSANTDMITFKSTSNGDVQFVGNYKDITISGRSYDTKQKFLTAFSNLANQGSVDAYTKAETDAKIDAKQGKLKAGNGITLTEDATDNTTVVKTAVSLTDNGNGAYTVGDSIGIGGRSSVRIGDNNNVLQGQNSIVIGDHAVTSSEKCIAIGNSSEVNAGSTCSIVIGDSARAYSKNSVAIGNLSNATNDNPLVINAGYKTVDGNDQPLTVLQSDANGKISLLKGDGTDTRMVIQDEIEALKNAGGGGTVDAYTKAETDTKLEAKQDKLTAGTGITITKDETAGTSTIATAVSLTDNGNGHYQVGDSIKMGNGIAIGSNALASYNHCIAVGLLACSSSNNGIAVGYNANIDTYSNDGIAVGCNTRARGENSVAIGKFSEATKDNPLVINAGFKKVDGINQPLTLLQSDSTGKLSILKGDGTDERIVIQDALSAGGSGGTVDAYTKAETDTKLDAKQDKLTAGSGITITKDETAGTSTIATAVSLTDNGEGAYQVGNSIKMGSNTVAIGTSAVSRTKWSIAIGDGATSGSGGSNIAIGNIANSSGGTSIAIGKNAVTSNMYATAIGTNASAGIPKSIAIGYGAKTSTNIPMVINAGGKTMIQGDTNGKISILLGDGTATTMCLQDEIAALKAEIAALKGGTSTGA